MSEDSVSETTTTRSRERENLPVPPAGTEPAYELLLGLGCSPTKAIASICARLADGWEAAEVVGETEAWGAYCRSPRGRSLKAPGFFVAARLERGILAPDEGGPESGMPTKWATGGLLIERLGIRVSGD